MKKLVLAGAVVAGSLLAAPLAFADDTGPDADLCIEAEAELEAALQLVLGYNPDVYPGDMVPALDDLELDLLQGILGDADLGAGARAEVEAAVAAFAKVDQACDSPVTTTPPTVTPQPTTTKPAPGDKDCDTLTQSKAQTLLKLNPADPHDLDIDGDGVACEEDGFDQVGTVPVGSVATGGGPA